MADRAMTTRDCNTCLHHCPGKPIPKYCRDCLSASGYEDHVALGAGEYLPLYEPKENHKVTEKILPIALPDRACAKSAAGADCAECRGPKSDTRPVLPTDPAARKGIPIASGVIDYFPSALAEVAKLSKAGNDQHNPGQPLHWARGKSMDHADTIMRHFIERGTIDTDGVRHSAKLVWRALALLQMELEAAGAPMARGAK